MGSRRSFSVRAGRTDSLIVDMSTFRGPGAGDEKFQTSARLL